jgi:tetratricopeptide (TPR) repeat protein
MFSHERILNKLDSYLQANDYEGAERHLLYWEQEALTTHSTSLLLLIQNELIGLYRKLGKESECLRYVHNALSLVHNTGIDYNIGAATTYINCATAYKAFHNATQAIDLFERALRIYQSALPYFDERMGALYNNMGLALADLGRYPEAYDSYARAIDIMQHNDKLLEVALTYLNIASTKDAELGLEASEQIVAEYMEKAMAILNNHPKRDGYYAFVCDKCASVAGYYGFLGYKSELEQRRDDIYARA